MPTETTAWHMYVKSRVAYAHSDMNMEGKKRHKTGILQSKKH